MEWFRIPSTLDTTMSNKWYLAYGSNLSSQTFRGRRGIRPLAEANVVVPNLELTFDLPGIPYWEPCFANVRMRTDKGEGAFDMEDVVTKSKLCKQGRVLLGVAYLVTPEDLARIIATEGGGLSYDVVDVECWHVSEKMAEGSTQPLIASTLLAPDSRRRSAPMQPSKRYIEIIRAGAREHDMPPSYIAYLDSIPYYHITSHRQRAGAVLFLAAWLPLLLAIFALQMLFADRQTGRLPRWVGDLSEFVGSAMWKNYLGLWRRTFGSGEVTDSDDGSHSDLEQGRKNVLPE